MIDASGKTLTELEQWRELYRISLVESHGDERRARGLVESWYQGRIQNFNAVEE